MQLMNGNVDGRGNVTKSTLGNFSLVGKIMVVPTPFDNCNWMVVSLYSPFPSSPPIRRRWELKTL